MYDIFYVSKGIIEDSRWANIKQRYPFSQKIENVKSFEDIRIKAFTKMFWVIWDDIELTEFDLLSYRATKWDDMYVHVFKNGDHYDGICLFPKTLEVSSKEWNYRYFLNKKEIDIIASNPLVYDRYVLETYEQYQDALENSKTELFWCTWPGTVVTDESIFKMYFSNHNTYDRNENHVFKNSCNKVESFVSGTVLFSKSKPISKREFDRQFLINKKEYDIVATKSKYPTYTFKTYEQYIETLEKEASPLFWGVWENVEVVNNEIFDLYFDSFDGQYDYDRSVNHVFKNSCDNKESYLNGIVLFSKEDKISSSEFKRKFLINKKEHDILVSRFRYPKYTIETYDQYLDILKNETSPLFWGIWNNIDIVNENVFDFYFDPNDGKYDYDRSINHVFKNACGDTESYLNGIVLFSKEDKISQIEFRRKFLINKKEHDILASRFRYPRYEISSYSEYIDILEREQNSLFWCIWPEVEITDNRIFDMYFDPNDGKYDYDRSENHVFKNVFRNEITHTNGIVLFSKNKVIGEREFKHRFLIQKKEHNDLVSKMKPYDIVFISYNEPNADENYNRLLSRYPLAKRIHGVKGIHQAHIAAAKMCDTEMFWVVDGDAIILDEFNFDHEVTTYEKETVHVWRSQNPINGLVYGYGGVKLLPRELTLNMNTSTSDMTTSISKQFKAMPSISNVTAFNTDAFSTWRSAFRECVKLSSKVIDRQNSEETMQRLTAWLTFYPDKPFAQEAAEGAFDGREYGRTYKDDLEALRKINDFEWLKARYEIQQKH